MIKMNAKSGYLFLLTKPPHSSRSKLCIKLIARSNGSKLYLAGDGVYHLLSNPTQEIPPTCKIYACKEDIMARGIAPRNKVEILEDFYERLVEDVMERNDSVFTL